MPVKKGRHEEDGGVVGNEVATYLHLSTSHSPDGGDAAVQTQGLLWDGQGLAWISAGAVPSTVP